MKEIIKNLRNFATIEESRNTIAADVNEILLAYMLASGAATVVNDEEAKSMLKERAQSLTKEQFKAQQARAGAMKKEILSWAAANGFGGVPIKVWWTARPGILQKAMESQEISTGNPSDILVQFSDESFLGISAKSTKSAGDVGFKNPGIGSIGRSLGINLKAVINNLDDKTLERLGVPNMPAKARKAFLRLDTNSELKKEVDETGREILKILRDFLLEHINSMEDDDIRNHLMENWLDAGENYPYYIKVTGRGNSINSASANVEDPIKNGKYKSLMSNPIAAVPVGNDSIGIQAGGGRIMKMRFKYESQKLASSLKMSGDPW